MENVDEKALEGQGRKMNSVEEKLFHAVQPILEHMHDTKDVYDSSSVVTFTFHENQAASFCCGKPHFMIAAIVEGIIAINNEFPGLMKIINEHLTAQIKKDTVIQFLEELSSSNDENTDVLIAQLKRKFEQSKNHSNEESN